MLKTLTTKDIAQDLKCWFGSRYGELSIGDFIMPTLQVILKPYHPH